MIKGLLYFMLGFIASILDLLGLYQPYSTWVVWLCIIIALLEIIPFAIKHLRKGSAPKRLAVLLFVGLLIIYAISVGMWQIVALLFTPIYIWISLIILLIFTGLWATSKVVF